MIGAGNVAWHLGPALQRSGYNIVQVYSRSIESAHELGAMMGIPGIANPDELSKDADLVLISVSDKAIESVTREIYGQYQFLVHTAGSVPAAVFRGAAGNYGVFYPFMTFTRGKPLDLNNVPFCLESNTDRMKKILHKMAGSLTTKVYHLDFQKRKSLHLAGIIANNFSNHMYHLAEEYLSREDLDFEMLKPLILETAEKVMQIPPGDAQTGPAKREDGIVIESHIGQLDGNPELQKLYTFVSDSIRRKFSETNE